MCTYKTELTCSNAGQPQMQLCEVEFFVLNFWHWLPCRIQLPPPPPPASFQLCPRRQLPLCSKTFSYIATTFAHRFGRNVNIYKGQAFLAGVAIIPSFFGFWFFGFRFFSFWFFGLRFFGSWFFGFWFFGFWFFGLRFFGLRFFGFWFFGLRFFGLRFFGLRFFGFWFFGSWFFGFWFFGFWFFGLRFFGLRFFGLRFFGLWFFGFWFFGLRFFGFWFFGLRSVFRVWDFSDFDFLAFRIFWRAWLKLDSPNNLMAACSFGHWCLYWL